MWQTMIDTETGANKLKGMLPAKTVVGHKTGSSDRNADGMKKLQIMMPASLSFPTAGNTTLPPSSWTHTRRMRTMRTSSPVISRMVYDAMMREARGLLVAPPISFDTRVYPAENIAVVLVIYAGNNAEARC